MRVKGKAQLMLDLEGVGESEVSEGKRKWLSFFEK